MVHILVRHHGDTANSMTVQTEVLAEGLSHRDLVTVSHELMDGLRVSLGVTGGEACRGDCT